jgi:hypothetical protein
VADDPRRLGRPGAYRLGELRPAAPPPRRPRAPREPSFGSRRSRRSRLSRGSVAIWLAGCAVAAALLGLGAGFGWWFLPFVAGMVAGAGPWRARPALALAVVAVLAGWGGALWWPALSGAPAGATARAVAALAGLPPYAAVGVAGTLLVGVAQTLVAFWLARALTAWTR